MREVSVMHLHGIFFFQAEDGIRDLTVTGVQTCALPILVFDVDPVRKNDKGRFVGRIWVEDQDYHIVRFNGAYGGSSLISNYFNFDSWRKIGRASCRERV